MRAISLLLVILLVGGVSSDTVFHANGTLTCKYHHPIWCFSVSMWEKDVSFLFNTDDLIARAEVACHKLDKVGYHLEGSQDGDGPFDAFYEAQVVIVHNCTFSGLKRISRTTKYINVDDTESLLTWDLDVTQTGDHTKKYDVSKNTLH